MKKLAIVGLMLLSSLAFGQNVATVTDSALVDKNGNLVTGSVEFKADREFGFGNEQCCQRSAPITATVTAGAFSISNFPLSTRVKPNGVCFALMVRDAAGNDVTPAGYNCVRVATSPYDLATWTQAGSVTAPNETVIGSYLFANKPVSPRIGALITVSDGTVSSGKCAGSGTDKIMCRWNGTDWDHADSTSGSGVTSVNTRSGAVTLTKSDVSLSNVDNTSDAGKPVSTAQQTALNAKVATSVTVNGHALSGNVTVTNSDLGAVPTSTTVNGHALSGNVTVGYSDLTAGALANGTTATTQASSDNSTKVATTAYVDAASGSGGSSAFSSLTSGTNSAAAMVVGSGASLGVSGTGTIAATTVAAPWVTALPASGTEGQRAVLYNTTGTNDLYLNGEWLWHTDAWVWLAAVSSGGPSSPSGTFTSPVWLAYLGVEEDINGTNVFPELHMLHLPQSLTLDFRATTVAGLLDIEDVITVIQTGGGHQFDFTTAHLNGDVTLKGLTGTANIFTANNAIGGQLTLDSDATLTDVAATAPKITIASIDNAGGTSFALGYTGGNGDLIFTGTFDNLSTLNVDGTSSTITTLDWSNINPPVDLHGTDVHFRNGTALTTFTMASPTVWAQAEFTGDALSQASVDGILCAMATNTSAPTVDTSGGTSAAPSATGLACKATIIGNGGTVTTN